MAFQSDAFQSDAFQIDSAALATILDEASINAIAAAIWARVLPLDPDPVYSYGTTSLSANDLDAITRAVWRKTLP